MAITLDITPNSTVVCCSDCPWWRAFAFTADEGRTTAGKHEAEVHPEQTAYRRQMGKTARRRASHRPTFA